MSTSEETAAVSELKEAVECGERRRARPVGVGAEGEVAEEQSAKIEQPKVVPGDVVFYELSSGTVTAAVAHIAATPFGSPVGGGERGFVASLLLPSPNGGLYIAVGPDDYNPEGVPGTWRLPPQEPQQGEVGGPHPERTDTATMGDLDIAIKVAVERAVEQVHKILDARQGTAAQESGPMQISETRPLNSLPDTIRLRAEELRGRGDDLVRVACLLESRGIVEDGTLRRVLSEGLWDRF